MASDPQNPYASPEYAGSPGIAVDASSDRLATRWERFAGSMIDGFIVAPLALIGGFALGAILVLMDIDPVGPQFNILASIIGALLGASIFLMVNGYLLSKRGQTVGKVAMKTRIVSDTTGELLPFGPLVLKRYVPIWVLTNIPIAGGFFALVNALLIFRENHKCLHDDLAGTKVIKFDPLDRFRSSQPQNSWPSIDDQRASR